MRTDASRARKRGISLPVERWVSCLVPNLKDLPSFVNLAQSFLSQSKLKELSRIRETESGCWRLSDAHQATRPTIRNLFNKTMTINKAIKLTFSGVPRIEQILNN